MPKIKNMSDTDFSDELLNASQIRLVLITYEILLENIEAAKLVDEISLAKARETLRLLMLSLDMQYDISQELMTEYLAINQLLHMPSNRIPDALAEAGKRVQTLYEAWEELERQNIGTEKPEIEEAAVGVTYSKDGFEDYDNVDDEGYEA
jgi:flagellin-specific chaperone FliS